MGDLVLGEQLGHVRCVVVTQRALRHAVRQSSRELLHEGDMVGFDVHADALVEARGTRRVLRVDA